MYTCLLLANLLLFIIFFYATLLYFCQFTHGVSPAPWYSGLFWSLLGKIIWQTFLLFSLHFHAAVLQPWKILQFLFQSYKDKFSISASLLAAMRSLANRRECSIKSDRPLPSSTRICSRPGPVLLIRRRFDKVCVGQLEGGKKKTNRKKKPRKRKPS